MTSLWDRRFRVAYAIVGIGLAWSLARILDAPIGLSMNTGLWFEIVALMVVAGFIFEPFFSAPSAAMVNCIGGIIFALGAKYEGPRAWWIALTAVSTLALILLILDFVIRDPEKPAEDASQRFCRVARQVGVAIGSWRFVLIATLALALRTFNTPFDAAWVVSTAMVLYVLALTKLQPHRLIAALSGAQAAGPLGVTPSRVVPPAELLLVGQGIDELNPGDGLDVLGSGRRGRGIVLSPTYSNGRRALRAFVPELSRLVTSTDVESLDVTRPELGDQAADLDQFARALAKPGVRAVGTVAEGTSIQSMSLELFPGESVGIGQVTWTVQRERPTFWQVVEARIDRSSWGGDTRRIVRAESIQLGEWDEIDASFAAVNDSPREVDLVLSGEIGPETADLPDGLHVVGYIPMTEFPVVVDLRELSLHHSAILGTTGTGKTHLAFELVVAMAAAGIQVICVDTTGQYSRRFPPPEAASHTLATIGAFLGSADQIAIFSPDVTRPQSWRVKTLRSWSSTGAGTKRPFRPAERREFAWCLRKLRTSSLSNLL